MCDNARREGRQLTPAESAHGEQLLARAKALGNGTAPQLRGLSSPHPLDLEGNAVTFTDPNAHHGWLEGPGDRFVASAGWKSISDPAHRGQTWTTGPVDVGIPDVRLKAGTLFEGTGGQGAGLIPAPQVIPGVVSKLFEPLGVAALFAQAQATTSSVRYVVEGTATSGAAAVPEGGTKPPSDLAFSTVDEPVKKVATVLTVSDELLDDAVQIQSYLNSRLSLFVSLEQERQILRGSGGNELTGIFGRSGINQYTKLAADDNATALAKVLANTMGSANLMPSGVIMHPTNWLSTRLLRDGTGGTAGNFLGGGPFGVSGNNAGAAGLFGQSLWNVPVALSTVVGPGTALVGAFNTAAQIYNRGGVSVEASNSHAPYFTSNLVMIRAESRQALACYRPNAFTEVRGLT
jgi:HK97 family phage major capsid protein